MTGFAPGNRGLLVITYHFPPDGAVGGLRWAGFAKYLARRGWEVHVVTAATDAEQAAEPGVIVHYRPPRRTLNDRYKAWAVSRRAARQSADPELTAGRGSAMAMNTYPHPLREPVAWLRRLLGTALAFPDVGRGWVLRAGLTARRLLGTRAFAAVITSGPPHSVHLAGIVACAGGRGRRWVDMRDPWSEPELTRPAIAVRRFDGTARLKGMLERRSVRGATRVVANTEEFGAHLRRKYPAARVAVVTNGIDLERLPPQATDRYPGLALVHAGTLYFNRTLTPIVRALEQFLVRHPDAAGAVKLRLAGKIQPNHLAQFWSDVDAAGVRQAVEVLGQVPRAAALDLIRRSHLALVLAQGQRMQVPAKLYECVALCVSTLVITEASSASAREAVRLGATTCEPDDVAGIGRLLDHLWQTDGAGPPSGGAIGYDAMALVMEQLLVS